MVVRLGGLVEPASDCAVEMLCAPRWMWEDGAVPSDSGIVVCIVDWGRARMEAGGAPRDSGTPV